MKLRSYLCLSDIQFKQFLKESEESADPVDWDLMSHQERKFANILQHVLINLCSGVALRLVQRNQEQGNGFESWHLLWQRYGPTQRSKGLSRIGKILHWKFRSNYQYFENDLNEWELEVQRFDAEQVNPLPDNIKVGVLISNIQGTAQEHLRLTCDINDRYDKVRDILINYFRTGRGWLRAGSSLV